MSKINHDYSTNAPRADVSREAFQLLRTLQDTRPELQALSASALFLLVCDRWGLNSQDYLQMVSRVLEEDKRPDSEQHFGAIRDYLKYES